MTKSEVAQELQSKGNGGVHKRENEKGFFKPFFNAFLKTVSENQLSDFGKITNDEDRVQFLNSILPICTEIVPDSSKDLNVSAGLKERGTAEFVRGDTVKALLSYTESILRTPFGNAMELAVTVGNRSATLYHLEKFSDALQDIEYALNGSYPKELCYKLHERKARCLLGLKRHDEALESFRQTLKALDDSKLPAEKKMKMQKDIQIMFSLLTGGKRAQGRVNALDKGEKPPKENVRLPSIAGKASSQYPALSNWVTIEKSDGVGRFAVATQDIPAGQVVLIENSASSVLLAEYSTKHCQNCFKRTDCPLPCHNCSLAVFCSPACEQKAMAYHRYECTYADALYKSGVSVIIIMSLRVITQRPLQFFLDLRKSMKLAPEEALKKYKSDDYLTLYHLVRHEDQRPTENFFERSAIAVTLLRILKKSGYFGEPSDLTPGTKLSDDEAFIGGLILRHSQIMQFNAHEIAELDTDIAESLDRAESKFIAGGVYPTLALFNHSCNPGIVRYNVGTLVVAKTIRPVKKGEEISENYGPIFTTMKKIERQKELRAHYWFECSCQPCTDDWPLLSEMDKTVIPFRCAGTSGCPGVIRVSYNTEEFMVKCSQCGQHTNLLKGLKALQDTDGMFRQASTDMNCGKMQAALALYLEILALLHQHLAPPFNDYHMCQQAIRKCMLRMGNVNLKDV